MITRAGMKSLALAFPEQERTNDHWRKKYPEIVAQADSRSLARLWNRSGDGPPRSVFDQEMEPYLSDAFRGAVKRRVLGPDETPLTIELRAARRALEAAALKPSDVDLVISASFFPNQYYVGNAVHITRDLGTRCAAWNLETACSGSIVMFQTACALVASGQHRNVLCVTSCNYTQVAEETDTLSWFMGDGAAAFVVSATDGQSGFMGGHTVPTIETCGTFYLEMVAPDGAKPRMRMLATERSGGVLRETSEQYLRACVEGALQKAGVTQEQVDFFVFNTPTAWYGPFCARTLGVPADKTINMYSTFANTGPVLMPTNLWHAAKEGRIRKGDLVLLYAVGSVSTATASVMRWGDVSLHPELDIPRTT